MKILDDISIVDKIFLVIYGFKILQGYNIKILFIIKKINKSR